MIYLALGWIVCGVAAYLVQRHSFRRDIGSWTTGDRMLTIFISTIVAPAALLAFYLASVVTNKGNKEARW